MTWKAVVLGLALAIVLLFAMGLIYVRRISAAAALIIENKKVEPKSEWYIASPFLPIPRRRAALTYGYLDSLGNWIPHGPARRYDEGGLLREEAYYLEGKLSGTQKTWAKDGSLATAILWKNGQIVGMAGYDHDKLQRSTESLYNGPRRVGEKLYEGGSWHIAFYCGEYEVFTINVETGDLQPASPPWNRACYH